ncbi:hypothetical protein DL546_001049 [Coniochaeta pulveracea]|uniref:Uncharacterized protein n=1 Tax=Coniochaeta pulveracea TaxID=177199 RepID=A0A420XXR4_9PEZI|nr:hypothetical protein DL546_001049 [Coniochaeta pulveracea]
MPGDVPHDSFYVVTSPPSSITSSSSAIFSSARVSSQLLGGGFRNFLAVRVGDGDRRCWEDVVTNDDKEDGNEADVAARRAHPCRHHAFLSHMGSGKSHG